MLHLYLFVGGYVTSCTPRCACPHIVYSAAQMPRWCVIARDRPVDNMSQKPRCRAGVGVLTSGVCVSDYGLYVQRPSLLCVAQLHSQEVGSSVVPG